MSTAARHAKVYGYDLKTVFADTSADQKCVLSLTAARSAVQEGANLQLNTSENLIVNFLKNHFIVGYVFSVPRLVFAAALQPVSREFSEIVYEGRFLDAMLDKSLDDVDVSADDRAFFEVVDPRPENKFQIRTSQIARSTTKVQVKKLDVLGARADAFVLSTHGDHHALDLLNWCPPDYFDELMSSLLVYVAAADEPTVQLRMLAIGAADAQTVLQPSVEDGMPSDDAEDGVAAADGVGDAMMEDALALLGDFDLDGGDGLPAPAVDVDGAGALAPVGEAGAAAPAAVGAAGAGALAPVAPPGPWSSSGLVSASAMTLASELACGRRFSENGSSVSRDKMDHFNEVACRELVEHGIIECALNGVGELPLALRLRAVQLRGQLLVSAPSLVANTVRPTASRKFEKFGKLEIGRNW